MDDQQDVSIILLRMLMRDINSDLRVVTTGDFGADHDGDKWVRLTHGVIDAEGEVVGAGTSEGDAIVSAIRTYHAAVQDDLDTVRAKVRDFRSAVAGLNTVS
jgi:hypothetical protein